MNVSQSQDSPEKLLLPALEREAGPKPKYAVIWQHGLWADGHDYDPIVDQFDLGRE